MDRQKYAWNQDYRDGYDDGVKDGREQMKKQIEYINNQIKGVLVAIQNVKSEE